MIPVPSLLTRSGLVPRLMMQLAASALLTIFYTPGGAAGWVLELVLRGYFGVARRFSGPIRLAALVPVPVRAHRPSGLMLSNLVEK
jgi:hypothetical protein